MDELVVDTNSVPDPGGKKCNKSGKDFRSRHWTYLFETLRRTVDAIYDTCQSDRNIFECKEAALILHSYHHDFEMLIENLQVEEAWEKADKPVAVAWEIRKTMGSPTKVLPPDRAVTPASNKSYQPDDPSVTKCDDKPKWFTAAIVDPMDPLSGHDSDVNEGDGWSVVSYTKTRKNKNIKGQGYMYPRSAMDIPQTKASLAKMAHSRKRLWENKQPQLEEIMHARRRAMRRQKGGSMPAINFKHTSSAILVGDRKEQVVNNGSMYSLELIKELDEKDGVSIAIDETSLPANAVKFFWEGPVDSMSLPARCGWEEEYKQLTEEEESLALEEESLQKAYREEEMKSIDEQIERQMLEAQDNEPLIITPEPTPEVVQQPTSESTAAMPWADLMEKWNAEQKLMSKMSWADLVDMEMSKVELSGIRVPGVAAQMHEKLSSPSRKRATQDGDAMRRHEERLAKAETLRQKLQDNKLKRMRVLSNKVEQVRIRKGAVTERKRQLMESKMAKAVENRQMIINKVVQKARDEEEKVHEVWFINNVKADIGQKDLLSQHMKNDVSVKQRLAHIQQQRIIKVNQKAAKETAAEERRKLAAQERQSRLRELAEKKRVRSMQAQLNKCEQNKEKVMAAREKSKERKERLADIKASQLSHSQQLKSRICHKQCETSKRHSHNLSQIKLRAMEMSTPRLSVGSTQCDTAPSSSPLIPPQHCTICNVTLHTELTIMAHVISANHRDAIKDNTNDNGIISLSEPIKTDEECETNDENIGKQITKRKKQKQKLKQKITAKVKDFSGSDMDKILCEISKNDGHRNTSKMSKLCSDVNSLIRNNPTEDGHLWMDSQVFAYERALKHMRIHLATCNNKKSNGMDYTLLWTTGTGDLLLQLLATATNKITPVSERCMMETAVTVLETVAASWQVCVMLFYSSRLSSLMETVCQMGKSKVMRSVAATLISCIATVFSTLNDRVLDPHFWHQLPDNLHGYLLRTSLYSHYLVVLGFIDIMQEVVGEAAKPDSQTDVTEMLNLGLYVLVVLTDCAALTNYKSCGAGGVVVVCLEETRLCGLLDLIYDWLVQPTWPNNPNIADNKSCQMSLATFVLFNRLATAHKGPAQSIVSGERDSLQFRFICSSMLKVCETDVDKYHALLLQVVLAIGHFVSMNPANQSVVNCAPTPMLTQMCRLPSKFVTETRLKKALLPTLIACAYKNGLNRQQMERDIECAKLTCFIQDEVKQREANGYNPLKLYIFEFANRLPFHLWQDASEYFSTQNTLNT